MAWFRHASYDVLAETAETGAENAENCDRTFQEIVFVSALSALLCGLCENPVCACLNKDKFHGTQFHLDIWLITKP